MKPVYKKVIEIWLMAAPKNVMKLRTVKFYDCDNQSNMQWLFQGNIIETEKDLRNFAERMHIKNWFAKISHMSGQLIIRGRQ